MGKEEKLSVELEKTQKLLMTKLYKMRVLRNELHATKNDLRQTQRTLLLTADKLKDAQAKISMMKQATDDTVCILREYLFLWLTPMNQFRVKRMLRFYNKQQQVRMMSALLSYVIFGEKTVFTREVERWHFKIIISQIDEDAISLPTHTMMVKLFKKYGLFEEPNFRPFDQEW